MINYTKFVKQRIDNYIEFDSDLLFKNLTTSNQTLIFGGAVRDSISGFPINDIDILIDPINYGYLSNLLKSYGYFFNDSLTKKGIQSLYKEIQIISEPKTFFNRNGKIIQLIKPRINNVNYINSFSQLVSNVDISSCALSYDGNIITEHYPNAFYHATYKIFHKNPEAILYSPDRSTIRTLKLISRGWRKIEKDDTILNSINRDKSINHLFDVKLFECNYEQKSNKTRN
jgi:hypothetical protein